MGLTLDVSLTPTEQQLIAASDPRSWFTQFRFNNAESPRHPAYGPLEVYDEMKRRLIVPWLKRVVPGKSVLDTFSANGGFGFEAARSGARSVLGVEFDESRVACANLTASILANHGWETVPHFNVGDVYKLSSEAPGPFDVTLCLGGLYHVADPVFVLRQLRSVTTEGGHLLLQTVVLRTTSIVPLPGAWATFWSVQEDRTQAGFSSLSSGSGRWHFTWRLVDQMLSFVGFRVLERKFSPWVRRAHFPWYCVLAVAT